MGFFGPDKPKCDRAATKLYTDAERERIVSCELKPMRFSNYYYCPNCDTSYYKHKDTYTIHERGPGRVYGTRFR